MPRHDELVEVQWIAVKPDGEEVLLTQAWERVDSTLTFHPVRCALPYGKRIKGPEGDAAWAELKKALLAKPVSA